MRLDSFASLLKLQTRMPLNKHVGLKGKLKKPMNLPLKLRTEYYQVLRRLVCAYLPSSDYILVPLIQKASLLPQFCLQCRRPRFDPWVGKIPWRRKRQPTPVFLPGKACQAPLSMGLQESDTT